MSALVRHASKPRLSRTYRSVFLVLVGTISLLLSAVLVANTEWHPVVPPAGSSSIPEFQPEEAVPPQPQYRQPDVHHQTYYDLTDKQLANAKLANDLSMLSIDGVVSVSVTQWDETLHRTDLENPVRVWYKDNSPNSNYLYWYEAGTEHILSVPSGERAMLRVCQPAKRKHAKPVCRWVGL